MSGKRDVMYMCTRAINSLSHLLPFYLLHVLLWRDRARYRPHLTDMQEPSGIERRDMAITNNTPGEALWTRGYPTEDHQIRSGHWNPSVKASEKKKKIYNIL